VSEAAERPTREGRLIVFIDAVFAFPLRLLDEAGSILMLAWSTVSWAVRPPYRALPLLSALEFIGAGSLFIVGLVGLFTGMAFTVSTIVGFRQFSAEGMVGGVVALALSRVAPWRASLATCVSRSRSTPSPPWG
jgi:phospholipid/cholesterol/gamma-HCH transport system permease protein